MAFLAFLNGAKITPNEKTTTSRSKDHNPVTADLRLYANGSVYPSATLVKRFNLEYSKENTINNGFDIISSKLFPNTASSETPFLMIAPVAKSAAKVDLFGTTRFNEDGTPTSSVMTQGSNNSWLVDLIHEVYGTIISKGDYVDLVLVQETELANSLKVATNGVYNVPKTIVRGEKKGEQTYVRRENLDIYVLVPKYLVEEGTKSADIVSTRTQLNTSVDISNTVSSNMEV